MLDVGAADAGRGLRPQGPALTLGLAASGLDPEELLLDDIGDFAHAAFVHGRALEHRCLDGGVAVAHGQVAGGVLEAQEDGALGGQQIAGAPGGLELGHRPLESSGVRSRPEVSFAAQLRSRWTE